MLIPGCPKANLLFRKVTVTIMTIIEMAFFLVVDLHLSLVVENFVSLLGTADLLQPNSAMVANSNLNLIIP